MIDDQQIINVLNLVDPDNIRVYQPTKIILVCGGRTDAAAVPPLSLRDAFMRIAYDKELSGLTPILAEDLEAFFPRGNYRDLLRLESDIAQLSHLIIIFSESHGSAAELGAFSVTEDIAQKILIFIDDHEYEQNSFIKLGPVRLLQNTYGDATISVLHKRDLNINNTTDLSSLNKDTFKQIIIESIQHRMGSIPQHTTFNKNINGHIAKLIVGLIQWYGALTLEEIEVALYCLGVSAHSELIENLLLCCEFAQWTKPIKRGTRTFHTAISDKAAVLFTGRDGQKIPKHRWQTEPPRKLRRLFGLSYAAMAGCSSAA